MASTVIELMAHLMRSAGFGAAREELERRVANGYEANVEELINPRDTQYLPDDVVWRFHMHMHECRPYPSIVAYWLYRLVTTNNPLEEKMALFWHGVFATGVGKTNEGRSILDQVDLFRRFGLCKFDDLLVQLSRDPSMIIWLDNNANRKDAVNENYGRELLELFSMGIGNYTEDDIKEGARAFTGWTLANAEYMSVRTSKDSLWPYGRIAWQFEYQPGDHDGGIKRFLGEVDRFDGEDIVSIIARQPATARFVARHLYDFFVADEVPVPEWSFVPPRDPDAIDALAQAYIASDHDIRVVLRTLFNSDFFKETRFARVKTPAELVVGTLRLTGGFDRPTPEIMEAADVAGFMGQSLMNPPSVEGWHGGTEWVNSGSIIERANFAGRQFGDVDKPGVRTIIDCLAGVNGGCFTPDQLVESCLDLIGPISISNKRTMAAMVEHVAIEGDLNLSDHQRGDESEGRVAELLRLIASSREYQMA